MAMTVAFLAANIRNYSLLMINSVHFSNVRFLVLKNRKELKVALNES